MTLRFLLAIETSCDDTSIALVSGNENNPNFTVHSFESFSQEVMLRQWGGVVPELAARNHIDKIFPLIRNALKKAEITSKQLDAIAVTSGPGLLGPLLTGINTAKAYSFLHQIPLISVNHLYAHIEAIHFDQNVPYPYLGCVISGGHTFFCLVESSTKWTLLGSTVDDALGEALDKGGKLLGLHYPAGKILDQLAPWGNPEKFSFAKGLSHQKNSCAVSYSGIKNALRLLIQNQPEIKKNLPGNFEKPSNKSQIYYDAVSSYMHACFDTLIQKIPIAFMLAAKISPQINAKSPLVFGGGVAMSQVLKLKMKMLPYQSYFVSPALCTDNALMIASWAWKNFDQKISYPKSLNLDAFSRLLIAKAKLGLNMKFNAIANKSLGQHFLKDKNVINQIMACAPKNIDSIIEVGPGTGALTIPLIALKKPLLLIEQDTRFAEHWKKEGIDCLHLNALKIDWRELQNKFKTGNCWLVSNLPYNISAPLTVQFLRYSEITHMTLMYQKEVANKILALDVMNSLHALCFNYFDLSRVINVKPGAFLPPPKVDSTVINFVRKKNCKVTLENFQDYEKFLRHLFSHPRKQLNTVLSSLMPVGWKKDLENSIQLQRRAETLLWDEVFFLYQFYSSR